MSSPDIDRHTTKRFHASNRVLLLLQEQEIQYGGLRCSIKVPINPRFECICIIHIFTADFAAANLYVSYILVGFHHAFQQHSCPLSFLSLFSFCFLTRKSDSANANSTPWSYIRLPPSTRLVNLEAVYKGQRFAGVLVVVGGRAHTQSSAAHSLKKYERAITCAINHTLLFPKGFGSIERNGSSWTAHVKSHSMSA